MSLRLWMWAIWAAAAWGQSPALVATRIYVGEPCGQARPVFFVDGTAYNGPATLLWPEGSKHLVSVASQEIAPGIRCSFSGWTGIHQDGREDPKLDGLTIAVTAGRDLTALRAEGTLEYRLQIQLVSEGSGALFACAPGPLYGKIYVNGQCFAAHGELWIAAGSEVPIQAYPPPGFVFNGWQPDLGAGRSFESKFLMNRPIVLYALFAPAVRVTLNSEPPELELLADRTRVRTPITLDWAEGSRHTLAPVSPQMDQWGAWWVFDSWSNGQPAQQVYVPQNNNVPESLTARFIRGAQVSLLSDPPGLKLEVDGRDNWPSYDFLWGVGTVHTVSAPAEQLWRGRRYAFQGWSNGGPAAQQVTVPGEAAASGLRLVARYELLARLRIESTHEVTVGVNGSSCRTPCLIEPRQGSVLELRAPERVMVDEWRRLEFVSWADQAPRERLWTAGPAEETLTLNYQASYRVLALVAPAEGAVVRMEPASADGFYAAGSPLRLVAEPRPGFRFRRWDGDVSGDSPELTLVASEPRIVRAVLEEVPWTPPGGVRNAAGQGSVEGVAPGSLIAVYGANLAPEYVAGPDSPLAQSLGGVTVSVGERLLPLRFVSPEQINAQLFSDLAPGDYTLLVRQPQRPELSVPFKVVPCAPGLFTQRSGEREAVLALGEDGRLISFERPARRGELVTVLGTGFGPYRRSLPDGFAPPEELAAAAELAGEVQIPVGEHLLRPLWAGAAAGQAGVVAVRFRIGPEFPPGSEFPLKMRIQGAETNSAPLPLEPRQ